MKLHTLRPPGHPAGAFTPPGDPGGLSSKVDITYSRPFPELRNADKTVGKWDMCHLQADTWPAMSATELQIHEPRRKMHGKHGNTYKTTGKVHTLRHPGHPAGAFDPPGGPGGLSFKVDITSPMALCGAQKLL